MKIGVVTFPGSNCDRDALAVAQYLPSVQAHSIWHKDTVLPTGLDVVIIPGGFSYGDYLRCGAIARFAPIMNEIITFANNGGYVLGICNGFQILTEAGLLPGVLLHNQSLSFVCKTTYLRVENATTAFTSKYMHRDVLSVPVAHGEGNYFADTETIRALEFENRIVFRYTTKNGEELPSANPNGAINNIAGIVNERGNVLGMMPHPERVCDPVLGSADGLGIFQSLAHR
jgi:phosphoribosylformylglycinamidine synthase subunit PurQ / glutaminase